MSETTFNIRAIPANLVEHFWKLTEPYVKRALDHTSGEIAPADVKALCQGQLAQLWLVSEGEKVIGSFVAEISLYPRRKHARILTLGGSRVKEWALHMDIIVCEWASSQGCQAVEAYVRRGFVPLLVNYNMKHKFSVMVKEL